MGFGKLGSVKRWRRILNVRTTNEKNGFCFIQEQAGTTQNESKLIYREE